MEEDTVHQMAALGIYLDDEFPAEEAYSLPASISSQEGILQEHNVHGVGAAQCLFSQSGTMYEMVRTLRDCQFGKVKHAVALTSHEGMMVRTSQQVAIKCMEKTLISSGAVGEDAVAELTAMQKLCSPGGHPNVLDLLEVIEDDTRVWVVLPFCEGGDMFSVVAEQNGPLPCSQTRVLFRQVIEGLRFIHTNGIFHRDLSLENILMQHNVPKIMDFGLCVAVPVDGAGNCVSLLPPMGRAGKFFYMAPEIFESSAPFRPFAADIWSCGIILFILSIGGM